MGSDGIRGKIKRLLLPGDSLTERAVSSGVWSGLINVSDRILRLGKLMFLATLLAPTDFGIYGISLLAIGVLRQFSQLGFNAALIRDQQSDIDHYLDTVWTLKLLRGGLIAVIAFYAAPIVGSFFSEPAVVPVLRAVAIVPLLNGAINPGVVYLEKDLQFHRTFAYKISGTIVDVVIAVSAAFILQNVWALVVGRIAGYATRGFFSYFVHSYRPSLGFRRDLAGELVNFGKWIFGSEILIFLILEGDDAFVGWFLGAAALGFYQMAYRLSNIPATEVTHTISKAALPTYSKIDGIDKIRDAHYRVVQLTALLSIPASIGIVVVSPVFVPVVLGENWLPIIPIMQILAISGAIRSIEATIGPILKAIDKPDIITKVQVLRVFIILVLIYPLTNQFGLVGAAGAVTISLIVETPISNYLVIKQLNGSISEFINTISIPVLSSVIMGVLVFLIRDAIFGAGIFDLLFLVFIGIVTYTGLTFTFDRIFEGGIHKLLQKILITRA